jgi:uracil-DNA glycosylase family 4
MISQATRKAPPDFFDHPLKVHARSLGARCDLCPCARTSVPVGPAGTIKPKLVVVGEGPGQVEERVGAPFIGRSGKFLDDLLASQARVPRSETFVTNAAYCRHDTDDGNDEAGSCCAPRLLRELTALPAQAPIVTLGRGATRSVLGVDAIKITRGFVFQAAAVEEKTLRAVEKKATKVTGVRGDQLALAAATLVARAALVGRTVLPAFHPAFVLRSELEKPTIEIDFRRIGRVVRGEWKDAATNGTSEVVYPIPARVKRALRGFAPTVSLDVETTETGSALTAKLICVGIGDLSGRVVVIWPWHERVAPVLAEYLRSRKEIVGHNLFQFDRVVLERHGIS